MSRVSKLVDTMAIWEAQARGSRHAANGGIVLRLGKRLAFIAPSEQDAIRASRRIFVSTRGIRLATAIVLAQIWLNLGALHGILSVPILFLLSFGTELAANRFWVRGWERTEWVPDEPCDTEDLETAKRGLFMTSAFWLGSLFCFLAASVWIASGPVHWLGSTLGAIDVLLVAIFGLRLIRLADHARVALPR